MRRPLAPLALLLAGLLASCGPSSSATSAQATACKSSRECPPGQACDGRASACKALADNTVVGIFQCKIDGDLDVEAGSSDVVARIDGKDYFLSAGAACATSKTLSDLFSVSLFSTRDAAGHGMTFGTSLAYIIGNPGVQDMAAGSTFSSPWGGGVYEYLGPQADSRTLGWVVGGSVGLQNEAKPGGLVNIWVDVKLTRPPAGQAKLSEPCATVADCGELNTTHCSQLGDTPKVNYCFSECFDGVCPTGGLCVAKTSSSGKELNRCVLDCGAGAACPAPLKCKAVKEGKACLE